MKNIKNILNVILVTMGLIILLSSCRGCGDDPPTGDVVDIELPPYARQSFGWVTFSNLTRRDTWVNINYNDIKVEANTYKTAKLYAGNYDYLVSYKNKKKQGEVQICTCKTTTVELPSKGYTPCNDNNFP